MPSINGHGPKRAILYARVSTDEQARSGYSLAQQIEALRDYAAREGYEVLEEVVDPGQSGVSLVRPGIDRVREIVASSGVSAVIAQDRDRFARDPEFYGLLRMEFEEYGCKLRALNDRGDESPEGQLTNGILDQLAKYERAKVAERTKRGQLRKAREGKLVAGRIPNYGFRYNEARDGYVVDEERMAVVRRIFRMIGVEGFAVYRVKRTLEQENVPTPNGGRYWSRSSIRDILVEDVYKPHSYAELEVLVAPEVAARLDPERRYGIWWFNRRRTKQRHVAEAGPSGRNYRRRQEATFRRREEWIAVPVPDAGIPQEWVDAAREAIKDNRRPSSAGGRYWELSGGVFVCGDCGRRMLPDRKRRSPDSKRTYCYYRCWTRQQKGKDACAQRKSYPAEKTEALVRDFVLNLLKDPNRLQVGLKSMIERESNRSHGDPEPEVKKWSRRLAEIDAKRARFQDMAAEGLITFEELRDKLAKLDETRKTTERELETLRKRTECIRALERDKNALLTAFADVVPDALDQLETEKLLQLYNVLRLRLTAATDGTLELSGIFSADPSVCTSETTPVDSGSPLLSVSGTPNWSPESGVACKSSKAPGDHWH